MWGGPKAPPQQLLFFRTRSGVSNTSLPPYHHSQQLSTSPTQREPGVKERLGMMQKPEKQAFMTKQPKSTSPSHHSDRSSGGWVGIWPALALVSAIGITLAAFSDPFTPSLEFYNTGLWGKILLAATKEESIDPEDYLGRAKRILQNSPLIDGHNDFPFLLRQQLHGEIYGHDFEAETLGSQTDFHRMKEGMMGGQFWSVYVPCPEDLVPGVDLNDPNRRVPDMNEPNVGTVSPILSSI